METLTRPSPHTASTPDLVSEDPKLRPVVWWAALGAATLVLALYIFGSWIASGPEATPKGPTPMPGWMSMLLDAQEIAYPLLFAVCVYIFFVRPWRRERRLTTDGMLAIACISLYWQDPIANYVNPWFQYNTAFFNYGSWAGQIPGFVAPNGVVAEPLLVVGPIYLFMLLPGIISANYIMRAARARWPQMGRLGTIGLCFVYLATLDFVLECLWIRTGFYAYGGTIDWLTIWRGHYYQFPIYESAMFGGVWTVWACIRYFRNDKGETIAERGIEQLTAKPRTKTLVRTLALVGAFNLAYLVFAVGWIWISVYQSPWPDDIVNRSYLNGLCGEGTAYACPGPAVPIFRPDSAYITPKGDLAPAAD